MQITLITGNQKKLKEIQKNITDKVELLSQKIDLEEIQSLDMEAISRQKAIDAYAILQKPILVDDSGVYFDAYYHFPGTLAKFSFAQLGFDGFAKLLSNTPNTGSMKTVLSYMDGSLDEPLQFVGTVDGVWKIDPTYTKSANINVPYNNIFYINSGDKPISETYDQWILDNHRSRAVKAFNEFCNKHFQ